MSSDRPVASADGADEADLAKAFQELARGERTATALENQLSAMESRIEELLAQAERDHEEAENMRAQRSSTGEAGVGQSGAGRDVDHQGGPA